MRRMYLYDGLASNVLGGKNPMAASSPSPIHLEVLHLADPCHWIFVIDEPDVAAHQVLKPPRSQCHGQIMWHHCCNFFSCLSDFHLPPLCLEEDWKDDVWLGQVWNWGKIGEGVGWDWPLLHTNCEIDGLIHSPQCLVVPDVLRGAHAGGDVTVIGPLGWKFGTAGTTPEDQLCV